LFFKYGGLNMKLRYYITLLLSFAFTLGCLAAEPHEDYQAETGAITIFNRCTRSSFVICAQTPRGISAIPLSDRDYAKANFILYAGDEIAIPRASLDRIGATAIIIQPRDTWDIKNPLRATPVSTPIANIPGSVLYIGDSTNFGMPIGRVTVLQPDDARLPRPRLGTEQRPEIPANPYHLFAGAQRALSEGKTVLAHHILSIDPALSVGISPEAVTSRTEFLIKKLRTILENGRISKAEQMTLQKGIELVQSASDCFRVAEPPVSEAEIAEYKSLPRAARRLFEDPRDYQDRKNKQMRDQLAPGRREKEIKVIGLLSAFEKNDLSRLKQILALKDSQDLTDWREDLSCRTILHHIVNVGWAEGLRYLLSHQQFKSIINAQDSRGDAPLHLAMKLAIKRNNFDMVNCLIACGARTDMVNNQGLTADQILLRSQAEALAWAQQSRLAGDPANPSPAAGTSSDVLRIIMGHLRRQPQP
jgi:hypothetical protein